MGVKSYNKLLSTAVAATWTGYFDIGDAEKFAIQVQHGSITGTFLIKERLGEALTDFGSGTAGTFDYVTNTDISFTAPADDVGNELNHYAAGAAQFYSIKYTHTSGTSSLHVGVAVMRAGKGG
jgi:hypothetical protein